MPMPYINGEVIAWRNKWISLTHSSPYNNFIRCSCSLFIFIKFPITSFGNLNVWLLYNFNIVFTIFHIFEDIYLSHKITQDLSQIVFIFSVTIKPRNGDKTMVLDRNKISVILFLTKLTIFQSSIFPHKYIIHYFSWIITSYFPPFLFKTVTSVIEPNPIFGSYHS